MDKKLPRDTSHFLLHVQLFLTLFDNSLSDLQEQIDKLTEITDKVEELHRRTTISSLTGGAISLAGGITSLIGLALMPVTLGLSLIVTGVGLGVAFAGGMTGATSNITKMIHQDISRKKIEEITTKFMEKINPLIKVLKELQCDINEIQTSEIKSTIRERSQSVNQNKAEAGIKVVKMPHGIPELARLVQAVRLGRIAAQVSKVVKVTGAISGVLSGLSVIFDIIFIVKDARKIKESNKLRQELKSMGKNGDKSPADTDEQSDQFKSNTLQFILTMKKTVHIFQETLNELKQTKDDITTELEISNVSV